VGYWAWLTIGASTLNPSYKLGPTEQIYPWRKHRNLHDNFANFEFVFAIKDPKLAGRGEDDERNTPQNRRIFFHNYSAEHNIHPAGAQFAGWV